MIHTIPQNLRAMLEQLESELLALPDTCLGRRIKVMALVLLYLRYEKVHFCDELTTHPHDILRRLVSDTLTMLRAWCEVAQFEAPTQPDLFREHADQEDRHQSLFNVIWDKYDYDEFEEYVERYRTRIAINNLEDKIKGQSCVDFGCGNGVFCFALLDMGAAQVAGVDFGGNNIGFAKRVAVDRGIASQATFKRATVYDVGFVDSSFDFAIQNGVFHHLNDQDAAYLEVHRTLKPGGYFWCYVRGEGSITSELFDMAVRVNENVGSDELYRILTELNFSAGKKAFLTDALKAVYAATTYDQLKSQLARIGFGDFERLVGGCETDYDHDKVAADPYGPVKFGEGDLRILARRL